MNAPSLLWKSYFEGAYFILLLQAFSLSHGVPTFNNNLVGVVDNSIMKRNGHYKLLLQEKRWFESEESETILRMKL
ncbi:hypothetical protein AB840_08695 [Megasphaera cerevisiae DSM 20462]|uniref:Uncharacterized protein n=1 Tax=Megasphaera cerevisiae DSM 20462 TaxID=1122219 RepID=A0A0J6WS23_9FIRM|nr:hypothetical protein AB840_08695 [Megasphaera cerevisiae DSM 20462]OKY52301.1 hypothetical protein BSR42_13640 [Megasphaera cerevisiae]